LLIRFSYTVGAALLLGAAAAAVPPLTTVQDVIYKADGTRFNGQITVSWSSFEASDNSAIATQMLTVKVVDGVLRVKLVPNTNATPQTYYSVVYNSDGKVQFNETWAVPPSTQALRLRDVRIAAPAPPSGGGGGPIQQSEVVGLIADLGARPTKAAGLAAGRVAFVNSQSQLESVAGMAGDCVRVDGSSGPCGAAPSFVDGEALTGVVDGANAWFALTGTPDPVSSLQVYRNGLLQKPGLDYTLSGRSLQFHAAATPQPGDTLLTSYRLGGAGTSSSLYRTPQVLCSGAGAVTNSAAWSSIGICAVPAGLLTAGDRLEIRFDLEHQGVTGGYSFELRWGNTAVLLRDAPAADTFLTGRMDANLASGSARFAALSWGSTLPLSTAMASAADAYAGGLNIDFRGKVAQAGETLALRNYTVVRVP